MKLPFQVFIWWQAFLVVDSLNGFLCSALCLSTVFPLASQRVETAIPQHNQPYYSYLRRSWIQILDRYSNLLSFPSLVGPSLFRLIVISPKRVGIGCWRTRLDFLGLKTLRGKGLRILARRLSNIAHANFSLINPDFTVHGNQSLELVAVALL